MIGFRLGRWNNAGRRWFTYSRIWLKGYIWTPFVKIKRRYTRKNRMEESLAIREYAYLKSKGQI